MAPPPKNQAEIDARNRWFAYRKGWRDAARDRHDPLIAEHPDGPIKAAYRLGRDHFQIATQKAFREARELYNVPGTEQTDILR